jgi:hypothetical protein
VWEIEFTDQFEEWWDELTVEQQVSLRKQVRLLANVGPSLGRPAVDRIHSSRYQNMKELRSEQADALRVRSSSTRAATQSCCLAATSQGNGTSDTSGRCQWLTICTTSISKSFARRV